MDSTLVNTPFPLKYRPNTLSDYFKGSTTYTESVIRTLLEIDDLNIVFVGPICSGKTILLNIMIRTYYNLQPHEHIPENDILYINNLKEQGISFFRSEMKTHSQSRSTVFGKKKMIVIDDIDSVNEQSQQTFRNYIDKYKHNVHFISVCTNIQKVIESFQSRVHIIKLEPPSENQLLIMYDTIVFQEKIIISEEAKTFLLKYCKNSLRSLLNQMEKMYILDCNIDLDICMKLCSEVNFQHFELYLRHLRNGELHKAIKVIYGICNLGYSVVDIYDYLFTFVKTTDLLTETEKYTLIPLFCNYITIFHSVHEDPIELALFTNRIYDVVNVII
jgi:DNA polymerase III delta prime subunit